MCLEVPRGDDSEMTGLHSTKGIIYYLDRIDRWNDPSQYTHYTHTSSSIPREKSDIGVYLKSMHLMGVHFMGVYLTGVHLIGVHLMGVHLMGVYLMECSS